MFCKKTSLTGDGIRRRPSADQQWQVMVLLPQHVCVQMEADVLSAAPAAAACYAAAAAALPAVPDLSPLV